MNQSTSNAITVRPREGAQILGIGLSTFWLKAKTDPDFPKIIHLGPRTAVVRVSDIHAYINTRAATDAAIGSTKVAE